MRLASSLLIIFIMAQANAGDDYNYSQISVSKQEMSAQLEKMRKDGQISEQQLKDAKAAVGGLSDDDMKDLTQKGVKQVQEGKMTTENESLVEKQMQGIQDNIKKMEDLNEKE